MTSGKGGLLQLINADGRGPFPASPCDFVRKADGLSAIGGGLETIAEVQIAILRD